MAPPTTLSHFLRQSCTYSYLFFFQAEDGIRDATVTGVQTCALPICQTTGCRIDCGTRCATCCLARTFFIRVRGGSYESFDPGIPSDMVSGCYAGDDSWFISTFQAIIVEAICAVAPRKEQVSWHSSLLIR